MRDQMTTKLHKAILIGLSAALAAWSLPVQAHPSAQSSIRAVLLDWAQGVAHANQAQVAPLLAAGFEHQTFFGPTQSRSDYLASVNADEAAMTDIDLRHGRYEIGGDRAVVGNILGVVMQTTRVAVEARLSRSGGDWQIERISQLPSLPRAARRVYPEQLALETVELEIVAAERGIPVGSRIHVEDERGVYWAPEGHMREVSTGWREDVGQDVVVEGKTWAYVPGHTRLRLPVGAYSIEVARGLETIPTAKRFEVEAGEPVRLRIELNRWSEIRREGWYSGDTHVHFVDPQAGLLELEGEDLNVLNILASKWGPLVTNVEHFTGAPSPVSVPDRIVYVGEETRHGRLGHSILLGLESLVYPLTWGGPSEGVPGGMDHPPMATQLDAAHAQGGLATAAHFPWPNGELAVDIALGKLDAVDVLTWADAFSDENAMPAPPAIQTWYRYLNAGFDLPATAGTDKMYNTQVSGSVRVYAKVEGDFDYDAWIEAIRAGRTFVTTAPVLTFEVDGHAIGETFEVAPGQTVRVRARSRSRVPIERLEIIDNGRVVATAENPDRELDVELEARLEIGRSTWLAARAYSPEKLPYQAFPMAGLPSVPVMAHTSPVYVSVDGRPRHSPEDARVLLGWVEDAIDWALTRAHFEKPVHRNEMIELFRSAEAIYRSQLPTGSKTPSSVRQGSTAKGDTR